VATIRSIVPLVSMMIAAAAGCDKDAPRTPTGMPGMPGSRLLAGLLNAQPGADASAVPAVSDAASPSIEDVPPPIASSPPPVPPAVPVVPPPAPEVLRNIDITNRGAATVCYVYVSSCSQDSWGDDILGRDTLPSGGTATVRVAGGCWDLRAEDCDHSVVAVRRNVEVDSGTAWAIGGGAAAGAGNVATLTVRNRTDGTVCYVFVSECDSDSWGRDVLDEAVLAPGRDANVPVALGCWDLKAEDCDRNALATRRNLQVEGDTTWTLEN
jgi:hypothetical protein